MANRMVAERVIEYSVETGYIKVDVSIVECEIAAQMVAEDLELIRLMEKAANGR